MEGGKNPLETFPLKRSRSFVIGLTVCVIVVVFVLWAVVAMKSETSKREIAKLYANAFVLYENLDFSKPYVPSQYQSIQTAIDAMKKVVDYPAHFPEWYIANAQIGFLYIYQQNVAEALPYLEQLKGAPSSTLGKDQALVVLARLYLSQKELDKAIKLYRSLELKTKGEILNFVRYQLGVIYSSQKETIPQAIAVYEKISPESSLRALADRDVLLLKATHETT